MNGSVMHLAVWTRPDISFTVGKLSQHMVNPGTHHGQAMDGLYRYLRKTKDTKIKFSSGEPELSKLLGYSDADYAQDKQDRKSTYGHVFQLGGGPISWASKKQNSVSTSTTEAEYVGMSQAAKQAQWHAQLLRDIGCSDLVGQSPYTVQLLGDNKGTLDLLKNPRINDGSKHIDVSYHHVRDLVKRGPLRASYTLSEDMVADRLTKPLNFFKHNTFVKGLGLIQKIESWSNR